VYTPMVDVEKASMGFCCRLAGSCSGSVLMWLRLAGEVPQGSIGLILPLAALDGWNGAGRRRRLYRIKMVLIEIFKAIWDES